MLNKAVCFIEPTKVDDNVAKVWKLSADDILDDDLVDDDALLDADDLKKPDPSTLRGTEIYNISGQVRM